MTRTAIRTDVAQELADAESAEVFAPIRTRLASLHIDDQALREMVERVTHGPKGQDEVLRLRARIQSQAPDDSTALFERYLLLRVALTSVPKVQALALPDGVKKLLLDEFSWLTQPKPQELRWLKAPAYEFSALCKIVTLRRFTAGQMHWEVDGLQRSMLFKTHWRDLPRAVKGIFALGGFRPAFVPHLAWRRRQIILSEREHYRSLFLMSEALEMQPDILGFVAEAWFYSPDTSRFSPHLAWAPRLFQTWGGTVVRSGRADASSGVFENSRRRRQAADAGEFQPTLGLVIWPRDAMRQWAAHYMSEHAAPC